MSEKKKIVPERVSWLASKHVLVPHDDEFTKLYPFLAEALWPRIKDGALVRQAGWLALKLADGIFTAKVVMPTEKLETQIIVESLVLLYDEIETAIRERKCVWVQTWTESKRQQKALDAAIDAVLE
jgi:hypothetical protein